ncbi:hypothetical protein EB796_006593 [Bugula neritina]|uniref:Uncharacterized protein n=1 Tax=Bugula neritina TaxID=10212 RepID=A0A7J7K8Y5_BUGNE|nr:hypothetical protein EB796_006593 [Bugula neritina]
MKGYCEPTLKQNLLRRGVIVLENTSYSILSYISQSTDTPIIHYPDVSSLVFNCEVKLSPLYKNASHLVNIELGVDLSLVSSPMLTAILCSPSKDSSFILEERFKHALSRLKSIIVSGRCLVNVSLRDIVNHLHLHTDLWRCGDVMLQASTRIFIEELSSLAMSTQSSHDIQLVNDVTTTISAWETALSLCKYISSVSMLVKVGGENSL